MITFIVCSLLLRQTDIIKIILFLQLQCTQDGQLIYAELATPVKINVVPQPSSVEDTAYAVIINHTDQTN